MELRHLRYFVAVAEELNFRRAAERLHVAQPALSVQIRQLEGEIGVGLLERDRHHVALTAAGSVFLGRARQTLQAADEATRAAVRAARGETGRLAVGFIAQLSYEWLPNVLRAYRQRFRDVEIVLTELAPSRQIEELIARRLDLGIIGLGLPDAHEELAVAVMSEEGLVVALPLDHPLATRRTLSLKELSRERFIFTVRTDSPAFNPWLLRLCHEAGFEPTIALEADRSPSVLNYVAAGFGVGVFPAQIGRLKMPNVRFVPLDEATPKYQLCVAWRRDNVSPALERFLATARTVVNPPRARPRTLGPTRARRSPRRPAESENEAVREPSAGRTDASDVSSSP